MAGGDAPTGTGGSDDHAGLPSELDSHDLAFTMGVGEASGADAFAFDPDADRRVVTAYRVPEGDVTLEN